MRIIWGTKVVVSWERTYPARVPAARGLREERLELGDELVDLVVAYPAAAARHLRRWPCRPSSAAQRDRVLNFKLQQLSFSSSSLPRPRSLLARRARVYM
jgi:hypothetical protein